MCKYAWTFCPGTLEFLSWALVRVRVRVPQEVGIVEIRGAWDIGVDCEVISWQYEESGWREFETLSSHLSATTQA